MVNSDLYESFDAVIDDLMRLAGRAKDGIAGG
jgi:hypothetical protein